MQPEDELDFDEDDLVLQPSTSTTVAPPCSSLAQQPPTDASTPSTRSHDPALDSLGNKLPLGWVSRISNTTGELYYRNTINNTSSWEIPTTLVERQATPPPPSSTSTSAPPPPTSTSSVQPSTVQQPPVRETTADKPLPTGPRSTQVRPPQPNREYLPPLSPSSPLWLKKTAFDVGTATQTLPTGPRSTYQNNGNNGNARYPPPREPVSSKPVQPTTTSTIPVAPSAALARSNNEGLPRGPRASFDNQQQRELPTSEKSLKWVPGGGMEVIFST